MRTRETGFVVTCGHPSDCQTSPAGGAGVAADSSNRSACPCGLAALRRVHGLPLPRSHEDRDWSSIFPCASQAAEIVAVATNSRERSSAMRLWANSGADCWSCRGGPFARDRASSSTMQTVRRAGAQALHAGGSRRLSRAPPPPGYGQNPSSTETVQRFAHVTGGLFPKAARRKQIEFF